MTIQQPANFWSRLPAHFALGAVAVVAAAIVIGAVAVRETAGSDAEPLTQHSPSITLDEDRIRRNEAALQGQLGDSVPGETNISVTEESIRTAEAALRGAFNLPSSSLVVVPADPVPPVPPYVTDGPLYP